MENWTAKRQLSFWLVILFVFGCSSWVHSKRSAVRVYKYWTKPAYIGTTRECDIPRRCYVRHGCGLAPLNKNHKLRIINGEDQNYGEFPSFVSVLVDEGGGSCGGVLVSDQHVLTAAHCTYENTTGKPRRRKPSDIKVVLAPHYRKLGTSHMEKLVEVDDICTSDEYRGNYHDHDWAVVTLQKPVKFNDYIQPACLPYNKLDRYNEANSYCYVMGLGFNSSLKMPDDEGTNPKVVQKLRVTQVACKFTPDDHEARFCWNKHKLDSPGGTCYGDSGSPVLCYMPQIMRWMAVGLVADGPDTCDHSYAASFVRLPLIYEQIERRCGLFQTPGCLRASIEIMEAAGASTAPLDVGAAERV